jgi:hypothetical protein
VQRIRLREQFKLTSWVSDAAWQQIKMLAHKTAIIAQEQQAATSGVLLDE